MATESRLGAPSGPCQNCDERPATVRWMGKRSIAEVTRNPRLLASWCMRCVLKAQIENAERAAASLPELRAQLEAEEQAGAAREAKKQ